MGVEVYFNTSKHRIQQLLVIWMAYFFHALLSKKNLYEAKNYSNALNKRIPPVNKKNTFFMLIIIKHDQIRTVS